MDRKILIYYSRPSTTLILLWSSPGAEAPYRSMIGVRRQASQSLLVRKSKSRRRHGYRRISNKHHHNHNKATMTSKNTARPQLPLAFRAQSRGAYRHFPDGEN